jgi:serine/threonine-protein kinase
VGASWEQRFDELVDLDATAQRARLLEIAGDDAELARFLAELLAADERAMTLIADPIGRRAPAYVAAALQEAGAPQRDRSGDRIGRYRLLRLLGRGGMAEVYLADRADGEFVRQVAVKRILPGLASDVIHARFLRERQILAGLDHPGIARLLDGGRSEDGDPYFVLEHVEGLPITEHCDRQRLPIADRLRLLAEVCDAVDAAHRQLVVHRDLKPSNILVTAGGQPKLLDFGIAKLLEDGGEEGQTRVEGHALTPSYAAPEQVLGEPVTTAADVFALGVLLFELLAGRKPFVRDARPLPALVRQVDEETLERPSTALRRAATGGAAEARRAAERRARQLEGDLDTIVGKALARDPQRRYASAAALADDLRRFLARRPIRARPDSRRYRLGRFVARHRLAAAAAALAAMAVLAGLAVALWQGAVARREARRAERVRDFLVDLFKQADPSRSRGGTVTAREILDAGARQVERELAADPGLAAELLDAIAQVERGLGLAPSARRRAERSLALREAALGADATATAASRVTLGEVLVDLGDLDAAKRALARAATGAAADEEIERRRAEAWVTALWHGGGQEKAIAEVRRRLAADEARHGAASAEAATWQLFLAGLLVDSSRVGEAVPLARTAAAALEARPETSGLERVRARISLANVLDSAAPSEEAFALFGSALALQREILGADHPEVAFSEIAFGFTLNERRQHEESERVLRHAIAVLRPLGHYELGSAVRYLGFTLMSRRRFAEAEPLFAEAESIYGNSDGIGPDHPLTRGARLSRGWALLRLERLPEAEAVLRAVAADIERAEGGQSNSLRTALKYLGEVRRGRGDLDEALALHRRARAIELEVFGTSEHPGVAVSDLQIALDLLARPTAAGLAEARRLLDEGLAILRASDATSPRLDELLLASGRLALAESDPQRALAEVGEAHRRMAARLSADDPELVAAAESLRAAERAAAKSAPSAGAG